MERGSGYDGQRRKAVEDYIKVGCLERDEASLSSLTLKLITKSPLGEGGVAD